MNFIKRLNSITLCMILVLVVGILYANTLDNNFVWDDHFLIAENQKLTDIKYVKNYFGQDFWLNSSAKYESGFYRPITLLSFFVNYQVWGSDPFGFHLFNAVLHCLNGILIFFLVLQLTNKKDLSFLVSLIFIIHPIQTETVAFISDVGDLLCFFFLLLGCLLYFLSVQRERLFLYVLSLISICLSFLSKENGMIGFVMIAVIDLYFISNLDFRSFLKRLHNILPYFLVTLIYIIFRAIILGGSNALTTLGNVRYVSIFPPINLGSHLLTICRILILYLEMFLIPVKQSISYVVLPIISILTVEAILYVFCVLFLFLLIVILVKENLKLISFGFLWFFLCILPVSNLIPISNTIAERFMYLPSFGLCVVTALAIIFLSERLNPRIILKRIFIMLLLAAFLFLSKRTIVRNNDWESDHSIFSSSLSAKPCSPIGHQNLNAYYNQRSEFDKARQEYENYIFCREFLKNSYRKLKNEAGYY